MMYIYLGASQLENVCDTMYVLCASVAVLMLWVSSVQQRTRASWPTKAHGARKRRMEVVRHRHGGGGGRARTKEDRAPLFFQVLLLTFTSCMCMCCSSPMVLFGLQVSEQHQEEELKHDHQEAPPQ